MKRIICLILLVFMILVVLVGCDEDKTSANNNSRINAGVIDCPFFKGEVIYEGDAYSIIRDVNTNVLYLVISGFRTATMTPLYNSDGTIQTYKEG